jgi:hypothetical protein
MLTAIRQILSTNIFQALKNANAPSAANPFLTDADIPGGGVYGSYYQYANSEAESTTASTSYQNKVTLTTPVLTAGTYKATFYSEISQSDQKPTKVRVRLDGVTVLAEIQETIEFSSGNIDYLTACGFDIRALTAAVHTVTLDYSSTSEGGTAKIRRARIELIRVS